jgi:preprotein translocase subunit SecF
MEFFKNANYNFTGAMKIAFIISGTLCVASLLLVLAKGGFRQSVDFTGGTMVQVKVTPTPAINTMRQEIANRGYGGAQVTEFGATDEFMINLPLADGSKSVADGGTGSIAQKLVVDLKGAFPTAQVEMRRVETVGPKIGAELRTAAFNSIVAGLVLISIYIWVRFVFRYGMAAILALTHDVILTLGVFSVLNIEISLQIIAALLTIIGYSLNDTIVVFDRIRENMKLRRKESYREVVNRSINETLSRTILTSTATFAVSTMLWLMGGPVIKDFAFTLCFGVIVGTYSSVFIAAPLLVWWYERQIADKKTAPGM